MAAKDLDGVSPNLGLSCVFPRLDLVKTEPGGQPNVAQRRGPRKQNPLSNCIFIMASASTAKTECKLILASFHPYRTRCQRDKFAANRFVPCNFGSSSLSPSKSAF